MMSHEKIVHNILSDKTVLIVDDDLIMRTILNSYLKDIPKIDLVEVSGGAYAQYCLNDTSKKLILVVTDIIMPEINGFKILKDIRSGNTRSPRNTPVIVISSDDSFKLSNLAKRLDANAYITKPVTYDDFMKTIIDALSKEITLMPARDYDQVDTDVYDPGYKPKPSN